jgi:alpha-L-rhamnosidase
MHEVKAQTNTPYGIIKSEWKKNDPQTLLTIVVPVNTTATVILPVTKTFRLNKQTLIVGAGKMNPKQVGEDVIIELRAGKYELTFH